MESWLYGSSGVHIMTTPIYKTNGVFHEKIISVNKSYFYERYNDRGYTLEEVEPCIVSKDGDIWTIDTTHESYPSVDRTANYYRPTEDISEGAGTELKKLLSKVGINSRPNCKCNKYAAHMNNMGVEWCSQNIEEIVLWLKSEASRRGLPFSKFLGGQIVKLAIKRAKKRNLK
jgi:hypothetical protein